MPRVAHSCSCPKDSSALELKEDLAADAVAESQVDERQHRDQKRERQSDYRHGKQEERRDREEDAAQSLSEVVGLWPVPDRSRLDDAARLMQHEPGVGGALADAAVGDHLFVGDDALAAVDLLQLVETLEGSVLSVDGRSPRDAGRGRDVAAALRAFLRQVLRGKQLAG